MLAILQASSNLKVYFEAGDDSGLERVYCSCRGPSSVGSQLSVTPVVGKQRLSGLFMHQWHAKLSKLQNQEETSTIFNKTKTWIFFFCFLHSVKSPPYRTEPGSSTRTVSAESIVFPPYVTKEESLMTPWKWRKKNATISKKQNLKSKQGWNSKTN